MVVSTVTLAERPDLAADMWSMPNDWPAFMLNDSIAGVFYSRLAEAFPEHQMLALDEHGTIVARINSVPFAWLGDDQDLPDRGWDGILERAFAEREEGREATAVSLLEARVVPARRGSGLSAHVLSAARRNARRLGVADLVAPVRPTAKSEEPRTPMGDYVVRVRGDGLPTDPWLRVHVRQGARVVRVCPTSMVVPGTLAQWRQWTGLPFTRSGDVDVPGALSPVHVSVEHDHAVYVEPNIWVHHRLPSTL